MHRVTKATPIYFINSNFTIAVEQIKLIMHGLYHTIGY